MADPCSKAVEMRHLPFQCIEYADSNTHEEYRRESEFPLSFFSSPFVRFTAQEHPAISNFASAAMNREHWSPWSPWGSAPDEPNHGQRVSQNLETSAKEFIAGLKKANASAELREQHKRKTHTAKEETEKSMWDEFLRNDQQRICRVRVINSLLRSATVGCIDHFQVAGNEVELRT